MKNEEEEIPALPQREGLEKYIDVDVDEMYGSKDEPKLYAVGYLDEDGVRSGFEECDFSDDVDFDDAIEFDD